MLRILFNCMYIYKSDINMILNVFCIFVQNALVNYNFGIYEKHFTRYWWGK